jgi:hypothetical protein
LREHKELVYQDHFLKNKVKFEEKEEILIQEMVFYITKVLQ